MKKKYKKIYFYNEEVEKIDRIISSYKKDFPKMRESQILKNIILNNFSMQNEISKISLQNEMIKEEMAFNTVYAQMQMEMITFLLKETKNSDVINALDWFKTKNPFEHNEMLFKNPFVEKLKEQSYKKIEEKENS